jgi:hypothetical protein
MTKSDNTARRQLIFFLLELHCIRPIVGAQYLFNSGAKTYLNEAIDTCEKYYQNYYNLSK